MKPERELAEKFLGVIPNDEAHEYQIEYLAYLVKEHVNEQLQQHSVMQAEGSDVSEGAAVASSAAGQNGSDGVWCKYIRDKRWECEADSECTLI
jgi:hypothetical protein